MKREDQAVEKRNQGYNCAQAVICTYADKLNVPEELLFKLSEGFGSGLGCTLGTCGALNAACMIASYFSSTANLQKPNSKAKTYPLTRNLTKAFEQRAGALQCRIIKGLETGEMLCECEDCVRIACRLIDEQLFQDDSFL